MRVRAGVTSECSMSACRSLSETESRSTQMCSCWSSTCFCSVSRRICSTSTSAADSCVRTPINQHTSSMCRSHIRCALLRCACKPQEPLLPAQRSSAQRMCELSPDIDKRHCPREGSTTTWQQNVTGRFLGVHCLSIH